MRRKSQFILAALALAGIPVGWVLYYVVFIGDFATTQILHVGNDVEIRIVHATTWEVSVPYYYEIVRQGKTVVPRTYFESFARNDTPHFEIIRNPQTGSVAVVESSAKATDLILYDPNTSQN